jgi:hypothetical protein
VAWGVTGVGARSIQWLLTRGLVFLVDDIDEVGLKREIIFAGRRLSMGADEQPVFPFDPPFTSCPFALPLARPDRVSTRRSKT